MSNQKIIQDDYEEDWKKVEELSSQGLPKSALEIVDKIYDKARKHHNSPQLVKAIIYKLRLKGDYEEEFLVTIIQDVTKEIGITTFPVNNILHSILAELYWNYYAENRHLFLDRTVTSGIVEDDIRTWDLNKILDMVVENYMASIREPGNLKNIPINDFKAILTEVKKSGIYRPTLYDFLAHRAVDFFMNDENSITKPAYRFEIDNPSYFDPADDFVDLKFETQDSLSLKYYALIVLQDLIAFHLQDKDPTAFVDVDLKRLEFVNQNAFAISDRNKLYQTALEGLLKLYFSDPVSTDVSYKLANLYFEMGNNYNPLGSEKNRWDKKKAHGICTEAIEKHPNSDGANNCKFLLQQINKPYLSLQSERNNVPDLPILGLLSYKNISKIYFRIIKTDNRKFRDLSNHNRHEQLVGIYKDYQAIKEWSLDIPNDGDFQQHSIQLSLSELPAGFYVILIGSNPDFEQEKGAVGLSTMNLTNISYFNHKTWDGNQEFFVLDRVSGNPLKGVKATLFLNKYDYNQRQYIETKFKDYYSNKDGYFKVPNNETKNEAYYIEFVSDDDTLYVGSSFYSYYYPKDKKPRVTTYFFTDRAIYRPGQTVYFKGIMLEKTGEKYKILKKKKTEVKFYDVNGQLISDLDLVSNEYGSFNGSFTAPSGVLNGQMRIDNNSGQIYISVEDYKRPKFEVTYEPVQGSYKLNEEVKVTGLAMAYAGPPIDNAHVKYRVVREVRFPYWGWWWRSYFPQGESMEIINGETLTDKTGNFNIEFTAIPDLSVDQKYNPVFSYSIYADVTDINGETHSAETSVSVGYKALLIDIDISEKVNKDSENEFKLSSTNLNGEFEKAMVGVKISRLEQPDRIFRKRLWPQPDVFLMDEKEFHTLFPGDVYKDENEPQTWKVDKTVMEETVVTEKDFHLELNDLKSWKPGTYVVELSTNDKYGEQVETKKYFTLFSPQDKRIPDKTMNWFTALKKKAEPGEEVSFVFGTGDKNLHVIYEVMINDTIISREWLTVDEQQEFFSLPVLEKYRGNFGINIAFIKDNRFYQNTQTFIVPHTDKKLELNFATFRDKLQPGQAEEWQIKISAMDGEKVAAEMLATMYDASLDVFRANSWYFYLYSSYNVDPVWESWYDFKSISSYFLSTPDSYFSPVHREYDRLNWFGLSFWGSYFSYRNARPGMATEPEALMAVEMDGASLDEVVVVQKDEEAEPPEEPEKQKTEESQPVKIRSDFRETAFFYPDLKTNENGEVIITFTMPEALTRWKMLGLAYTKDLKIGQVEKELVTQKELMIMPNAPRFFREGDRMIFSAKISSLVEKEISGMAELHFFNALTMEPLDEKMGNVNPEISFHVAKGESASLGWNINIPEGLEAITYRIVAKADNFSDGEEMAIPVLPNRMLLTESLPLPVRGEETKHFKFHKLLESGNSTTLRNYKLTLEFTSNPAWYAVQALPYLMEYPYECSEQIFSRFYSNSLATHIANADPKIRQVFEAWKNLTPDALLSNLEKNQELKYVLLEETPWVREAKDESERKKRIALLFDFNKMAGELQSALLKLQQAQRSNGGWPWFEGMPENRYITQHIVTGFGHLMNLGILDVKNDPRTWNMVKKAVLYLDDRIREDYERLKRDYPKQLDKDHIRNFQIQYLYARSYFTDEIEINKRNTEAFNYYRDQATEFWVKKNLYMQGMIGLALDRFGIKSIPSDIIKSLKEKAHHSEEMGMYWRSENSWYWYEAPIERQALFIEFFNEVALDTKAVEEMKIWLLKQKQTQSWSTTKSTVEAVYALLLRGTNLLAGDELVEITLGDLKVDPRKMDDVQVEAGTGYFQASWAGSEIKPEMGDVTVTKNDKGIAWGALYWQYFENLDKITPHETPLGLNKDLFIERNTDAGPVIELITENSALKIGDKIIVRIILSTDRDLEFVHLKDMRASAFEPVNVLSGYKWQGGLGYYESTRDASTNFFIEYMRKGTYVFEYPLVVSQEGDFSNGISTIQCMYAPEFSSHSAGIRISVK